MTEEKWRDKAFELHLLILGATPGTVVPLLTAALTEAEQGIASAAREFLTATEQLCDWMNGNDLSADHAEQKPDDYKRLCAAMERLQAALPPTIGDRHD